MLLLPNDEDYIKYFWERWYDSHDFVAKCRAFVDHVDDMIRLYPGRASGHLYLLRLRTAVERAEQATDVHEQLLAAEALADRITDLVFDPDPERRLSERSVPADALLWYRDPAGVYNCHSCGRSAGNALGAAKQLFSDRAERRCLTCMLTGVPRYDDGLG